MFKQIRHLLLIIQVKNFADQKMIIDKLLKIGKEELTNIKISSNG